MGKPKCRMSLVCKQDFRFHASKEEHLILCHIGALALYGILGYILTTFCLAHHHKAPQFDKEVCCVPFSSNRCLGGIYWPDIVRSTSKWVVQPILVVIYCSIMILMDQLVWTPSGWLPKGFEDWTGVQWNPYNFSQHPTSTTHQHSHSQWELPFLISLSWLEDDLDPLRSQDISIFIWGTKFIW